MNNSLHQFLSKFGDFEPELIDKIQSHFEELSLPKKTILLKTGRVSNYLYFLKKGLARNFYVAHDKEMTTDIVIEGELIASFASFISQSPSNETIELLEDSELYAISYNQLQKLYNEYPIMERVGRLIAEYHYVSLSAHTHMLKFSSTTERYEYIFHKKPELVRRAKLGIIASFLGMSIENLSRVRRKFE